MGAPLRVISNGLRTRDFAPVATRDDATDVLFIGELRAAKGVDVLLNAIAELQSYHGNDRRLRTGWSEAPKLGIQPRA